MNTMEEMVKDALSQAGTNLPDEIMPPIAHRQKRSLVVSVVAAVAVVTAVLPVALLSSPGGSGAPLAPPVTPPETTVASVPTTRPLSDENTRTALMAALQAALQSMSLENPPTDVEFERYISLDEYGEVMVRCLTDYGIPAEETPDGGVRYGDIPEEQSLAQHEAIHRCRVRFPTDPLYDKPLTSDQLRILYDYYTGELTRCLEAEGYETWPAPSLKRFMDSYGGIRWWSPYPIGDPRLDTEEEWYRLNTACPQSPPLDVLYGKR